MATAKKNARAAAVLRGSWRNAWSNQRCAGGNCDERGRATGKRSLRTPLGTGCVGRGTAGVLDARPPLEPRRPTECRCFERTLFKLATLAHPVQNLVVSAREGQEPGLAVI